MILNVEPIWICQFIHRSKCRTFYQLYWGLSDCEVLWFFWFLTPSIEHTVRWWEYNSSYSRAWINWNRQQVLQNFLLFSNWGDLVFLFVLSPWFMTSEFFQWYGCQSLQLANYKGRVMGGVVAEIEKKFFRIWLFRALNLPWLCWFICSYKQKCLYFFPLNLLCVGKGKFLLSLPIMFSLSMVMWN